MKKILTIISLCTLVAITGFILFGGNSETTNNSNVNNSVDSISNDNFIKTVYKAPEEGKKYEDYFDHKDDVVELSVENTEEIKNPNIDYQKFLPEIHKKEIEDSSFNSKINIEDTKIPEKVYNIKWKNDIRSLVKVSTDELPEQLPIFSINREKDENVFGFIYNLKKAFGFSGFISRESSNIYKLENKKSNITYLVFDIFNHNLSLENLNIKLENTSSFEVLNNIKEILNDYNILNIDVDGNIYSFGDEIWLRFKPKLPMDFIYLHEKTQRIKKTDEKNETYGFAESGFLDVEIDKNKKIIKSIYKYFPFLKEEENVEIFNTIKISEYVEKGEFSSGVIELKYPGGYDIQNKRDFFEILNNENININDAKFLDIECGYSSGEKNYFEHFYMPSCLVKGEGLFDQYSVYFKVLFPIF